MLMIIHNNDKVGCLYLIGGGLGTLANFFGSFRTGGRGAGMRGTGFDAVCRTS